MQMLEDRVNMELNAMDASREAKDAVANEKSRQKSAEWRLTQLAKQRAEVDAELSRMNQMLLKEQVFKSQPWPLALYTLATLFG